MIFADTPRWPNHGTLWGHLISDSSIEELHSAARDLGIHPRAFDLDHYDWPAEMRGTLEDHGVTFVNSRDLARTLIASGLRIPAKDRPALRRARTRKVLDELGLNASMGTGIVLDLIAGPYGHVEQIPSDATWLPGLLIPEELHARGEGAFTGFIRMGRDAGEPWWSTETSSNLNALSRYVQERLDAAAQARGDVQFVGQCLLAVVRQVE